MSRMICLVAAMAIGWICQSALAVEYCARPLGQELCCSRCTIFPYCCPDDYCAKPAPCIPCVPKSCCPDDYCAKPIPCIPCVPKSCCPDDYCRKPMPELCRPLNRAFYRCGPTACPSEK